MSARTRWAMMIVVTVVALGAATAYAALALMHYQERQAAGPEVAVVDSSGTTGPHVVFRNTAAGEGYGHVATVPLKDPDGPRSVTDVVCDRVYASAGVQSCLRTNAGVVTTFEMELYDAEWNELRHVPLPGIPSRTRVSDDGALVASTVFVTGHAYAPTTFSTATVIHKTPGGDYGNLEQFALYVDGSRIAPVDRNIWGITFASDGDTFYATAASGDQTWLVRGSIAERTITAVHDSAECPSLSPDGTRVAYKKNVAAGPKPHWKIAVLELRTNQETILAESRSVDDQVEWLDNSTLLYGLPREGAVGDSDIWAIDTRAGAKPRLYIEHAWSPSVVRP